MRAIGYLAAFELSGLMIEFGLGRQRRTTIKLWLGLVIGLMELMWLPSLYAFLFRFDMTAHIWALATALVAGCACLTACKLKAGSREKASGARTPIWLMLILLLPFCALAGYLHYTHTLREIDGALYAGQSTYGDLCMHAGFVTGLVGQSYPPEYTILPGTRLGYPFLADALSSSLYLLGLPLNLSMVIPGEVMTSLVFWGFVLFSWEITRSKAATALALGCLAFSGGLGFLYYYDLNGTLDLDSLRYAAPQFTAIGDALGDYYHAPANYPNLNLRWVNALCDLLIPQRTLMAGWMCLIPALYLLYMAMKRARVKDFVLLGCFAGPMVMIHTHSFLGLGVISLGAMLYRAVPSVVDYCRCLKRYCREHPQERRRFLFRYFLAPGWVFPALIPGPLNEKLGESRNVRLTGCFALYGAVAALIALPQLLVWTFPQTFDGGSLRVLFNWVNNNGDGTLKDNYLWFWLKNVGPMFLIIPIAAISSRKKRIKALALGSLLTFLLGEFVVFQPNVYDNNKLFWTAYLCMLPVGCGYIVSLIGEHKSRLARAVISIVLIVLLTASGALSIAREIISGMEEPETLYTAELIEDGEQDDDGFDLYTASGALSTYRALANQSGKQHAYQLFSQSHVQAAAFIRENTLEDALFLTANNHNNTVAVLTGRRIVCGPGLYLYYHGVDYMQQEADARLMLVNPEAYRDLYDRYGVDYVFISNYELSEMRDNGSDPERFEALYPLIYQSESKYWYDTVRIYAVSERAIVKFQGDSAKPLQ